MVIPYINIGYQKFIKIDWVTNSILFWKIFLAICKSCSTMFSGILFTLKIKSILIHEYQHKSTRVNTNQQESTRARHESTRVRHESTRVQHKSTRINTSPTRVNTTPTRANTSPTRVNTSELESDTSQHKKKRVLDELTQVNKSPTWV